MKQTEYGPDGREEHLVISEVKTYLDGTIEIPKIVVERGEQQSHRKFIFPKRFMAKINHCLMRNYLPDLWKGGALALWSTADEHNSYYMGTYGITLKEPPDFVKQLRKICETNAGAVLIAYTCFSLLCPFFSSYHRLNRQTSYLRVKRDIPKLVVVNIQGSKPEYAEELANCCCNYFGELNIPIIDGINIQKSTKKQLNLGINEFEMTILQPACVLWVNRIPTEELETSGRLINLHVDFSPREAGYIEISPYIMRFLTHSFYENTVSAFLREERFKVINRENKQIIGDFIAQIENFAATYSIPLKDMQSEKDRYMVQNFNYGNSSVRYLTNFMSRFKFYREDFFESYCAIEPSEKEKREEFKKKLHEIYLDARKRLRRENDEVALFYPFYPLEYTRKEAAKYLYRDAIARNLDKHIIKKLSYLLASFKVFASLCLPEEDNRSLTSKISRALLSTLVNQKRDDAQTILENYLFNLIKTGRFARIRGDSSNKEDIAVWYDPNRDVFLLPACAYFIRLKEAYMLEITKAQFENELEQADVLCKVERKRSEGRQKRKTFECVLTPKGRKVAVLKIPRESLSQEFKKNDVVKCAISKMCSDNTPFRSKKK